MSEEYGWLIEHGPTDGPVYLTAKLGWSRDSTKALRFARQKDAADFRREQLHDDELLRICEHAWG